MKKTKYLVLLTIALLVMSLICGCGAAGSGSASKPAEATAAPAPQTQPDTPPAAEPTQPEAEPAGVTYPLTEQPVELTLWNTMSSTALSFVESYSDNSIVKAAEEYTGVSLACTTVAGKQASELFPVMIAGGDLCDFVSNLPAFYASGVDSAIEEEIIYNLVPYLESCAPDYLAVLQSHENSMKFLTTDSGNMGVFGMITENAARTEGLVIRQDFLDQINMAAPETYDEYYDVLTAMKTELGIPAPLWINSQGAGCDNTISAGYGIAFNYQVSSSLYPFYVIDGEVRCGYTADELADYLKLMSQWYAVGLIWQDFATDTSTGRTISTSDAFETFTTGGIAVGFVETNDITTLIDSYAADTGMAFTALHTPSMNKGDKNHITMTGVSTQYKWSVTTSCDDPELACKYVNFFYTETGYDLCNYGIEGEAYNVVDGKREYTDLILNNPDEVPMKAITTIYLCDDHPFVLDSKARFELVFSPEVIETSRIWTENCDGAYVYPLGASMTVDENGEYNVMFNDMVTYAMETVPRFITGELNLTSDYEAYLAQLEELGVQDCVAIKQAAYDRYLAR